jgi:hypothetical protein
MKVFAPEVRRFHTAELGSFLAFAEQPASSAYPEPI